MNIANKYDSLAGIKDFLRLIALYTTSASKPTEAIFRKYLPLTVAKSISLDSPVKVL